MTRQLIPSRTVSGSARITRNALRLEYDADAGIGASSTMTYSHNDAEISMDVPDFPMFMSCKHHHHHYQKAAGFGTPKWQRRLFAEGGGLMPV